LIEALFVVNYFEAGRIYPEGNAEAHRGQKADNQGSECNSR
jgi:hypothetical protein